jgi:hypothetical protein
MLKTRTGGAAAVMLAAMSFAHAQDAVQWRVEDGGNGHWYELRPKVGDWFGCREASQAAGGDLASLPNAAENAFVEQLVPPQGPSWNRVFVGGRQALPNPPGVGWYWVDGSEWSFTDWYFNQPNGNEGFLVMSPHGVDVSWDDYPSNSRDIFFFIIEWSADCNGDGIVDYGQILDGTYVDDDANGVPDCCDDGVACECTGDLNSDGVVGPPDIGVLLSGWGTDGSVAPGSDINEDGTVNGFDLAYILGWWGPCP